MVKGTPVLKPLPLVSDASHLCPLNPCVLCEREPNGSPHLRCDNSGYVPACHLKAADSEPDTDPSQITGLLLCCYC